MSMTRVFYLLLLTAAAVSFGGIHSTWASEAEGEQALPELQHFEPITTGLSDEQLELEERFRALLADGRSLFGFLGEDQDQLREVLRQSISKIEAINQRLRENLRKSSDEDDPRRTWNRLRIGQSILHLACKVYDFAPIPEQLTDEQSKLYRSELFGIASGMVRGVVHKLRAEPNYPESPWDEKISYLRAHLDPFTSQSCPATAQFWMDGGWDGVRQRVSDAEQRCEGGDGQACRFGWRYGLPDERTRFVVQTCRHAPDYCVEAREYFEQAQDEIRAGQMMRLGCERGERKSCRWLAARPRSGADSKTEWRCVDGDHLACAQVMRADEESALTMDRLCIEPRREVEDRPVAEFSCTADGDPRACMTIGASLWGELPARVRGAPAFPRARTDAEQGGPAGSQGHRRSDLGQQTEACDDGDLEACLAAGRLLHPLLPEATEFFGTACEQGLGEACFEKARVVHDQERAARLFEQSCQHEFVEGCRRGAELLYEVQSEGEHHRRIVTLLQTYCSDESRETCLELAGYFDGLSSDSADQTCAFYYSSRACTVESLEACDAVLGW